MTQERSYPDEIQRELTTAQEAASEGNEGKSRVCARRAAGFAISLFITTHARPGWGTDALGQLQHLKDDATLPEDIRKAATRLTTRITDRFQYPFSTDPIADARLIVDHLLRVMNHNAP